MDTLAKNIMSTEIISITPDTHVEEALKVLVNNKVTGLPVVTDSGKFVGILSELDIIEQIMASKTLDDVDFSEEIHFSKNITSVQETTTLKEVLVLFAESKFRRLPVVNGKGRLVGIITRRDIMRLLFYRARMGRE